jgi:hypothetical protein
MKDEFEKMQAAFEETFPNLLVDKSPSGRYINQNTQCVWEGYRAALEQVNSVIPEGYKIAFDSVKERVAQVVIGGRLAFEEKNKFQREVWDLENKVERLESMLPG